MLCERCNENEATVFMTTVIHGEASQRNLCDECCEVEKPGALEQATIKREGWCIYCGAKTDGSSCAECRKELLWFMDLKGFTLSSSLSKEEHKAQLIEVMAHMKEWVKKGKPNKAE